MPERRPNIHSTPRRAWGGFERAAAPDALPRLASRIPFLFLGYGSYDFLGGAFAGLDNGASAALFGDFTESAGALTFWHTLFMSVNLAIVAWGLHAGIERAVTILMPALLVMLLIMVAYAYVNGDFARGLDFLFNPGQPLLD